MIVRDKILRELHLWKDDVGRAWVVTLSHNNSVEIQTPVGFAVVDVIRTVPVDLDGLVSEVIKCELEHLAVRRLVAHELQRARNQIIVECSGWWIYQRDWASGAT